MTARLVQRLASCLMFTAEVAALKVQAPPGPAQFEVASVQGAPALIAPHVADMEEAVKLLDISPLSCVSFDAAKGFAYFSVRQEDYYEKGGDRRQSASNLACRADLPVSATLMVPTYLRHQEMYNRLVGSVREFVTSRAALVSIFSSEEESVWMTGNCSACASTPLLNMRALIFDHSYENYTINALKANYQTAKKMWGLKHVEYDNVLMLDSDFAFVRPIALAEALAPYEHVVYEIPLSTFSGGIFSGMLKRLSMRFNSTMLDYVPFEMPWIFNKRMVSRLIDNLGQGYLDDILLLEEGNRIFDILLYRVFVLAYDPAFYSKHIPTTRLWFEDLDVAESERLAIHPPPIGVRYSLQEKQPCGICWLEAHADRGEKRRARK